MLLAIILLPLAGALLSWFIPADPLRRILLLCVAAAELCLAVACWVYPPDPFLGELLCQDVMGRMVLTLTCILFMAATVYAQGYLRDEDKGKRKDFIHGLHFSNAPEASFTACLLLFLFAAALVASTRHFGLLWVAIEGTTLASAPLIYFHRHRRSLEATWKYLMICSVGIALALLGNFLLDISMQTENAGTTGMTLSSYIREAAEVHAGWFKAAYVFLLIGYGTKMGIAPMHTWLPDAHSEAPSLVSALLSGALLNGAFLGIYRATQVSIAAGLADFSGTLLMAFGLFSLVAAALFIVGQGDFKRLLAYSSVEHMGILLLGLGACLALGNTIPASEDASLLAATGKETAVLAASRTWPLHMVCHSLVKGALFLAAGNILARYHTKSSHDVTGLARVLPVTGALWTAGIIAIAGSPPFGLFVTEFSLVRLMLQADMLPLALAFLVLLGIIFVGMITPTLRMTKGKAPYGIPQQATESRLITLPSAILLGAALALGLHMPVWLDNALKTMALAVLP